MAGELDRDGKITFYSKDQGRDLQVKEEIQGRDNVPCSWRWQLLDGHTSAWKDQLTPKFSAGLLIR